MESNNVSTPKAKTNTLAIVGFILAFIIPLVGFILSIISLSQIKKKNEGGKGLAISGIVISVVFMLIGILIISAVTSSVNEVVNENPTPSSAENTSKDYRFDDRADKQAKDVEIAVGESGTVDGRKLTVVSTERTTSLSEYDKAPSGKIYIVANVTIENTSDRVQTYNAGDFRIQTASGQVLDYYWGGNETLSYGDLVVGGTVNGNVTFEVPVEAASQYIIYKPNSSKSDRVIVEVKQ